MANFYLLGKLIFYILTITDMHFKTNLLEELRARRRAIFEIVIVVSVLGFVFNLLSNAFYDLLAGSSKPFSSTVALSASLGLIYLLFVVLVIKYLLGGGCSDNMCFRVLLPFDLYNGKLRIRKIEGYAPTWYANDVLNSCFRTKSDDEEKLILSLGLRAGGMKPNDFFNDSVHETMLVLLLKIIKEYSDRTLKRKGLYHPRYSSVRWALGISNFDLDKLPIDGNRQYLPQKTYLPDKTVIDFQSGKEKKKELEVIIQSPYTSLIFKILPYWTIIKEKNAKKTWFTATRGLNEPERICLLSIPVQVSVRVSFGVFWGKKADHYCTWMEGLLSEAGNWLSWERYQETDLERMIVEIYEKLTTLEKSKNL